MNLRFVHPQNVSYPMDVKFSGNLIVVRDLQFWKVPPPIFLTDVGIVTLDSEIQPWNVPFLIVVSDGRYCESRKGVTATESIWSDSCE